MFGLMRARTCAKHTEAWRAWRNHYCGTCKTIGSRYGQGARMALNHDTVFLAELLTELSGGASAWSPAYRSFNCMSLPKREEEMPAVLRYSAAATLVLADFKVADHVADTGRRRWRWLARLFSKAFRGAQRDLAALGFPVAKLRAVLGTQAQRERSGTTLAEFSAPTAEATSLFFVHGAKLIGLTDQYVEAIERIGCQFGELAYLLDAFEDFKKDQASGAFNAIQAMGLSPAEIVPQLQALVESIRTDLELLPLGPGIATAFGMRLKSNLDAKLGLHVSKTHSCKPKPASRKKRWDDAIAFARRISENSPKWRAPLTIGAVAVVAFLVPSHSRAAETPAECLSLGFNLMALGSVLALVFGSTEPPSQPPPILPPADPSVHPGKSVGAGTDAASKGGKSGCCGNCGCGCCDGCDACDCCLCEICSCEVCGGCGDCCGGCGDCCSGCDC